MDTQKGKIAIIGSGFIGRSWAMVFLSAGHRVTLYDVDVNQLTSAQKDIQRQLKALEPKGLLRGKLTSDQQVALLSVTNSLTSCLAQAVHVQECVPEIRELKQRVFKEMSAVAPPTCILASSSSAMPPSTFTADLLNRERCLVAHPVNPPYTMPLVELVPAPYTDPDVVLRTRTLLESVGQSPVILKKEIAGFIQPRIQYAIIQECLRLVLDDVMSVEDVDKIMTDGLGRRYAFMGPFETAHLNAEGMRTYIQRYADMIYEVSSESGPPVNMASDPRMEKVFEEIEAKIPENKLQARRDFKDQGQAVLGKIRRDMDEQNVQL